MIEIFDTQQEYNVYTDNNTKLKSDNLYYIKENGQTHFYTNNIDGEAKVYNKGNIPEGNITITENGENIDIYSYATASVNIPQPEGNITITENGDNINVYSYATATVNVPDLYKNDYFKYIENNLTNINIPEGVTKIGECAFYGRHNLKRVTISNTVTKISGFAFQYCDKLESITIPNSVTSFGSTTGDDNSIFIGCTKLTSITIPDSVTYICDQCFKNCSNLTNIVIGTGITSFGRSCFDSIKTNCSITIRATTPPTITSFTFYGFPSTGKIYVPAESVDAYKAAEYWSNISSKIYPIT